MNLDEINQIIGEKDFSQAKVLLEDFLKEDEFNVEALKLLGLCNLNLELYDQGRINFETVVKYAPDDASSWFYLANCYDNLDDFLHAIPAYQEVINLREEYLDAYKNLCVVYMKNKQDEKAVELAKKAIVFAPDDFRLYFLAGTALMALKNFEEAIAYLEKASELKPDHAQIYNNLGTAYITMANYDKAFENYQKATEYDPNNSITYYNMGSILQLQGKHQEACEKFKKAYEVEPLDNYIVSLALSEFKSGQYDEAIKHYRELSAKYPEKTNFKYNLVCCYEALGDLKCASEILALVIVTNPKATMMIQKLASIYVKMGKSEEAKALYENLMKQGAVTPDIYCEYAMLCMSTNDFDNAERIFKKVVSLNPNSARTHKDLGVIYLNKRMFEYAKDEFEKAYELDPENKDIIFEYANYLHATGDYVKADEMYKYALSQTPEDANFLTFAAKNKMNLNDNEAAYSMLLKALAKAPTSDFILFMVGKAAYLMKDYENAKLYLVKAYEIAPNDEIENILALCYFNLGNFMQANQLFLKILEANPKNTLLLLNSAKCYEQIGDKDKALEQLEKAVEIFPDFEEAHEMIRKLS